MCGALRSFTLGTFALLAACSPRPPAPAPAPTPAPASPTLSAETQAQPAIPTQTASRVIELWPEGVPGLLADAPPERIEDGRVYSVSVPTLSAFPVPPAEKPAPAVIVCPGGGYRRLAITHEGSEVTRWLNTLGVSAFVLKYRVDPYRHPAPLRDVLRAVRFVRANAAELGIDPNQIGVFGSSAGGHLAASAATLFDSAEGKTGAALDATSGRPDFVVLLYPVITMRTPYAHAGSRDMLLGSAPPPALVDATSLELHVTAQSSPAFLVHTTEDSSVPADNSLVYYQALRAARVPAELHIYDKGPHGFGLRQDLGPTSAWPERCKEWLRSRDVLP